jgi:hypothetical protein
MKKQIMTVLSVLVTVSASAQIILPDYGVNYKVTPYATPVPFTPTTFRQIESGALRLPLQIVPANPTPLTVIQPRVYLVPAPVVPMPSFTPAKVGPYAPVVFNGSAIVPLKK